MIGPEGCVSLLAVTLADHLPGKISELRERLEVTDLRDLPSITQVWASQAVRVGIEDWPLIEITTRSDGSRRPLPDQDPALGRAWRVTYQTDIHVWARGDGYDHVVRVRNRLALAVHEILAQNLSLSPTVSARIDDSSIATSYSQLVDDDSQGTLSGARISLAIEVDEALNSMSVPLVSVIRIDTGSIPD